MIADAEHPPASEQVGHRAHHRGRECRRERVNGEEQPSRGLAPTELDDAQRNDRQQLKGREKRPELEQPERDESRREESGALHARIVS
jgi:hypothetical protein